MQSAQAAVVAGNTEHTRPENRVFYPALDGLRAIAFLMVFGQHYRSTPWGWAGVDLFFVLSGFLITGILFDSRNDPHRVRNFYVRRTLRIFPLYYGVLLLLLLAYPLMRWTWDWRWLVWPAYLGNFARFVHPGTSMAAAQTLGDFQVRGTRHWTGTTFYLGHFWSLCVEEQFYLVWPWIVFWVRDRRVLVWICAVMIPGCLVLRLLGQHFFPPWMLDEEVLYRVLPFRLDALLTGGLVALLLRGPAAATLHRFGRIALPLATLTIAVYVLASPLRHLWTNPYPYPAWRLTWGLTILDLFTALVILRAIQPMSWVYRVLNFKPLRWLGLISYGLYVLHDIPHNVYVHGARFLLPGHVQTMAAILALPSTVLLAWLSFRFVESPFLDLKERWTIRTPRGSRPETPVDTR